MSGSLALLGCTVSGILYNQGRKWSLYIPILYFTFMEILQYFSYFALEKNNKKLLKILTIITFIHIVFQPLFVNLWYSNYIPHNKQSQSLIVLQLCIVAGVLYLPRLDMISSFKNNLSCNVLAEEMCGATTLIQQGKTHMQYLFKMKAPSYLTPSSFIHFFLMFIPALFLNVEMIPYLCTFIGWIMSYFLSNKKEMAAVWCTFSVPSMLISLFYVPMK